MRAHANVPLEFIPGELGVYEFACQVGMLGVMVVASLATRLITPASVR